VFSIPRDTASDTGSELAHNTPAMGGPLYDLLPPGDDFNSDDLLGRFLEYVAGKGLTLYPAQRREWVREVAGGLGAAL
jgi:hypothetical protein